MNHLARYAAAPLAAILFALGGIAAVVTIPPAGTASLIAAPILA